MMAVIFEVEAAPGQTDAYLGAAAALRPLLEQVDGFISIERFQSLTTPGTLRSLSFWRDETAVARWRPLTPAAFTADRLRALPAARRHAHQGM